MTPQYVKKQDAVTIIALEAGTSRRQAELTLNAMIERGDVPIERAYLPSILIMREDVQKVIDALKKS